MLIVQIVISYIIGIVLAEFENIYIPVALIGVAGILCLCTKKHREHVLLLFVVAVANIASLQDKSFRDNEMIDDSFVSESLNIYKVKDFVAKRISNLKMSDDSKSMAHGMLLGNKAYISSGQKQVIREAGMSHIMAISGLHIGVIAYLLFILFKPLRYVGLHRLHRTMIIVFVWGYVILVGSPLSAVRAALMVTLMQLSWILCRNSNGLHNLAATALIMLMYDSQQLWDVGFQLSFMATLGIILTMPLTNKKNRIEQMLVVTLSAQLFTFPIVAYWFHLIPIFGWIQGVVVVPMLSLLIYTLLLFIIFPSFGFLAYPIDAMVKWLLYAADKTSQFESWVLGGRVYYYPTIAEALMLELAIVGLFAYLWKMKRKRDYA